MYLSDDTIRSEYSRVESATARGVPWIRIVIRKIDYESFAVADERAFHKRGTEYKAVCAACKVPVPRRAQMEPDGRTSPGPGR